MNRELSKLDKKISELTDRSEALQEKRGEIQAGLDRIGAELPRVTEDLKAADDQGEDVLSLNEKRKDLLEDRDFQQIRLSGVEEQLSATEDALSQAISDRNACFARLAAGWLRKESETFNSLVSRLQGTAKRLFAVQQPLRETGDVETFSSALGAGARNLVDLRLVSLGNGFTRADMLPDQQRARLRPNRELCGEVFREVTQ